MSTILTSFDLHNNEEGRPCKIDFVEGLDSDHLVFIAEQWKPILDRQYDQALLQFFMLPEKARTNEAFYDIVMRLGIPDRHWDWQQKVRFAGNKRTVYGLLNGTNVEAALQLEFGHTVRGTATIPLVYVDHVAVAPWNRAAIQNPERFRRLGTLSLGAAVEVSRSRGFDGRCGLHSIHAAEGFYRKAGMKDHGPDPGNDGMRYFEFDAAAARLFMP